MKEKSLFQSALVVLLSLCCFVSIINLQQTQAFAAPESSSSPFLPEAYSLRDEYIVFAQNQDKHGYCWNFAATMSASTTLMKATGEYYDFAELWTGLSCFHSTNYYPKMGDGGYFSYHYEAMQNDGVMLETDLPFQYSYVNSSQNAEGFYDFYNQYANDNLADCLVFDEDTSFDRTEVENIKNHIYQNGSVYMEFDFRTGFLEENGVYALTPHQKNPNSCHAVSVIGWDDNYQRTFYLDGSTTPTVCKGAWMILNSYTERNSNEGIAYIFYEDTNILDFHGYKYQADTTKDFYFYDKIESGYAYPTSVAGKYYGDLVAKNADTKQKNIFYDDVDLEYSYAISKGASIESIDIYADNINVTNQFDVEINHQTKRFRIKKEFADYGQYKVVVTYGNGQKTDTFLNNFFVTHGLIGEEVEIDCDNNSFAFSTGKDLEFFSFNPHNKHYVIYTNTLSGTLSFMPLNQSIYSEKNMSIPPLSYEITDGKSCTVTHTVTANDGYVLRYYFTFEYCEDTTMQPVNIFYDLDGGINHPENDDKELASENKNLLLHNPTRPGYTFVGWSISDGNHVTNAVLGDGVYSIDWQNIHHMGESPTLFASWYYKAYYKNSNVVFVRALWEEMIEITYTVDNIADHYLSLDPNAQSGEQWSGLYDDGQTVYLFIKKPADTIAHTYTFPDGFESINDAWARKAIVVSKDSPFNAEIQIEKSVNRYTVTWKNWDNSVLYEESYAFGEVPHYQNLQNGVIAYPEKPDDQEHCYAFVGWSPLVQCVSGDASYIALYQAIPKQIPHSITLHIEGAGDVTCDLSLSNVAYGESRILALSPEKGWEILCVYINGEKADVQNNQFSIEDITQNTDVLVVFQKNLTNVVFSLAIISVASLALLSSSFLLICMFKAYRRKREKLCN